MALSTAGTANAYSKCVMLLVVFDALTESLHGFATLARANPGPVNGMLIESIDFLIITDLQAWDQEEGAQEL